MEHVNKEIAVLLKEKGFDVLVRGYWFKHITGRFIEDWSEEEQDHNISCAEHYSRPTLALAADWLREKHGLHVHPIVTYNVANGITYLCNVVYVKNDQLIADMVNDENGFPANFMTHNEALSAAITHALKSITI